MPSKRVADRIARSVAKFQQVLQIAKTRDVNESDTVAIIQDMLTEVFGYDKYLDVTSELAVRGTFCDLAIKADDKIEFVLEAKAIGTSLKEGHMRQARDYGANKGVQWVILTNGILWQIYKIRFEQPIGYDLVCDFDFSLLDGKSEEDQNKLFIICKEGINKDAREQFHAKTLCLNRFTLGALVRSEAVVSLIRRELKKISGGVVVPEEDIIRVFENEVLKREVIEGDDADRAQSQVKKFYRKASRQSSQQCTDEPSPMPQPKTPSFSDQLLNDSGQGMQAREKE